MPTVRGIFINNTPQNLGLQRISGDYMSTDTFYTTFREELHLLGTAAV
jgi:hypothetical protein